MGFSTRGGWLPRGGVFYRRILPNVPSWVTAAGSLGAVPEGTSQAFAVAASDPQGSPISYSVVSGSLPAGFTLNPTTGAITGKAGPVNGDAVVTFTLRASTLRGTHTDQEFSITVGDYQPQASGRVLWFDAADTTTYSTNSSSQLLTWTSKTTNSQSLSGAGSRPYVAYTQNGLPTMTFSFANYANFGGAAPTMRTIIAVMRYRQAPSGKANFFLFCDPGGYPFHGNGYGVASQVNYIADSVANTNFYNASVSVDGGTSFAAARSTRYWNDFRVVICRLAGGIARTANIGLDRTNVHCFAGDLAELIVWNGTLATADEQSAVTYLKNKWAV